MKGYCRRGWKWLHFLAEECYSDIVPDRAFVDGVNANDAPSKSRELSAPFGAERGLRCSWRAPETSAASTRHSGSCHRTSQSSGGTFGAELVKEAPSCLHAATA